MGQCVANLAGSGQHSAAEAAGLASKHGTETFWKLASMTLGFGELEWVLHSR
jgi:hypothetical protein